MKTAKDIHNLWVEFLSVNSQVEEMENYADFDGSPALAMLIEKRNKTKDILVSSIFDFAVANQDSNPNAVVRVLRSARHTDEYEGTDVLSCVQLILA